MPGISENWDLMRIKSSLTLIEPSAWALREGLTTAKRVKLRVASKAFGAEVSVNDLAVIVGSVDGKDDDNGNDGMATTAFLKPCNNRFSRLPRAVCLQLFETMDARFSGTLAVRVAASP